MKEQVLLRSLVKIFLFNFSWQDNVVTQEYLGILNQVFIVVVNFFNTIENFNRKNNHQNNSIIKRFKMKSMNVFDESYFSENFRKSKLRLEQFWMNKLTWVGVEYNFEFWEIFLEIRFKERRTNELNTCFVLTK